jgi:hypothetical protein
VRTIVEGVLRQPADNLVTDDLCVIDYPTNITGKLIASGSVVRLSLFELVEELGLIES